MSQMSKGATPGIALACVVFGIMIALLFGGRAGIFRYIGLPELLVIAVPILFISFWVLLIGGILRWMGWIGPGHYYRRLEDLPADFDDWHRRAHERMRETAPADDSGRRG